MATKLYENEHYLYFLPERSFLNEEKYNVELYNTEDGGMTIIITRVIDETEMYISNINEQSYTYLKVSQQLSTELKNLIAYVKDFFHINYTCKERNLIYLKTNEVGLMELMFTNKLDFKNIITLSLPIQRMTPNEVLDIIRKKYSEVKETNEVLRTENGRFCSELLTMTKEIQKLYDDISVLQEKKKYEQLYVYLQNDYEELYKSYNVLLTEHKELRQNLVDTSANLKKMFVQKETEAELLSRGVQHYQSVSQSLFATLNKVLSETIGRSDYDKIMTSFETIMTDIVSYKLMIRKLTDEINRMKKVNSNDKDKEMKLARFIAMDKFVKNFERMMFSEDTLHSLGSESSDNKTD